MTLDEFFEKLPKDGWYLTGGGDYIRRNTTACDGQCPITSFKQLNCRHYDTVGESIGLPERLIDEIINAADNTVDELLPDESAAALRQRLLEHCGLTEAK